MNTECQITPGLFNRTVSPAVVLVDIILHEKDGRSTIQEIKSINRGTINLCHVTRACIDVGRYLDEVQEKVTAFT